MKKAILGFSILLLAAGCGAQQQQQNTPSTSSSDQMNMPSASQQTTTPPAQTTNTPSTTKVPTTTTPKTTTPATPATPATFNVSISNFAFAPNTITVKKGDKVVWTNQDSAPHTVTGNNGGPSSGNLATGQSYSYTFNSTGTFTYHCTIHPTMAAATVIVTQ